MSLMKNTPVTWFWLLVASFLYQLIVFAFVVSVPSELLLKLMKSHTIANDFFYFSPSFLGSIFFPFSFFSNRQWAIKILSLLLGIPLVLFFLLLVDLCFFHNS